MNENMTNMNKQRDECLTWALHPATTLTTPPHRSAWNALNRSTTNQVFMTADAIVCALRNFGNGKETLAIARQGDDVRAMCIVNRQDPFRWSTFQPSQIPLGAYLQHSNASLPHIAESLLKALPGFPLVLSLTQIDPLSMPRCETTPSIRFDDYIETGWVELAGDFDTYWAARGKNLRQNMRKQARKIEADALAPEFRTITQKEHIRDAVARYGMLESAGWKSESGTAIHPDNDQGRFYSEFLSDSAETGNTMVYEYWLGGKLAASNLCVQRDGTLVILKTTYDEAYSQLSPAFLLLHEEVRCGYETGAFNRIEFFGRKKDWHTRWTEDFRMLYHVTAYRSSLLKKIIDKRRPAERAST